LKSFLRAASIHNTTHCIWQKATNYPFFWLFEERENIPFSGATTSELGLPTPGISISSFPTFCAAFLGHKNVV
jgi:hypothetical protein